MISGMGELEGTGMAQPGGFGKEGCMTKRGHLGRCLAPVAGSSLHWKQIRPTWGQSLWLSYANSRQWLERRS